jgi:hypothetical protein
MMAQRRLTDSELAQRLRQRNRQASERRRVKLAASGNVQLLVWIPASLRERVDAAAAANNATISDMTERLLTAGLKATTTATPATRDKPPAAAELIPDMFLSSPATTTDKDSLMTWVGELLNEGLTGADIARQLNASGKRTASGAEFTGQNLLRDYRAWCKKTGSADTTSGDAVSLTDTP